jgi:hypothetical protein
VNPKKWKWYDVIQNNGRLMIAQSTVRAAGDGLFLVGEGIVPKGSFLAEYSGYVMKQQYASELRKENPAAASHFRVVAKGLAVCDGKFKMFDGASPGSMVNDIRPYNTRFTNIEDVPGLPPMLRAGSFRIGIRCFIQTICEIDLNNGPVELTANYGSRYWGNNLPRLLCPVVMKFSLISTWLLVFEKHSI